MADSDGEVRGMALDLLFQDFNDEVETKLDEEFNGEIEEAMNEVSFYLVFCFSRIHSHYRFIISLDSELMMKDR